MIPLTICSQACHSAVYVYANNLLNSSHNMLLFFKMSNTCIPQQIEKLEAHASYLLDAFIRLRQRYAILDPMLFNETATNLWGFGERANGFNILKYSLFLSCVQDIANLSMDDDKRTPSLKKIIEALASETLRSELKTRFSEWIIPNIESETDPEIIEALKHMGKIEKSILQDQFDELYDEASMLWTQLATDGIMVGFLTIRHKITAHTEIHRVEDKYQLVDIKEIGIKWSDMKTAINKMQRLVALVGLLVRNSSFDWDLLDVQLSKSSAAFWGINNPSS
jgi:hypothetical protein